eukprot:TRINITY_DN1720_c0_g1_i1.p1 TRINITY_DN1720_c0_g1~~TRINITY_DN1720_c0_g1_i1.p1  ORF type:complete len:772 (-),score=162.82 TRINITY_DN1720_c0_g1_i1:108-2333(-)
MSWHLDVDRGRQVWRWDEKPEPNPSMVDIHHLNLKPPGTVCPPGCTMTPADSPIQAARKGIQYMSAVQCESGHWAGDYGGPMFLLPGLVITCYVTGYKLHPKQIEEMIRYLLTRQNKVDGGWGIHVEAQSDIFGTALQYVSLRILGLPADHPAIVKAREFLHANEGVLGIPSWGKLWLAVLNVYSWDGLNPIPIEMWLAPYWLPVCPGRMWCHCRMVYLPMAYLYARRVSAKETPLVLALRKELYTKDQPYEKVYWPSMCNKISPLDNYSPNSTILKMVNGVLWYYEKVHWGWLRRRAIDFTYDHIKYEDEQTKYIDIGPVNKTMNMLCCWDREGDSPAFRKHGERLVDYLWLAPDGMKMQGYNGSQLWDSAFWIQAVAESGLGNEFVDSLRLAHHYLEITQVPYNTPNMKQYFRHISKGAWPFSTVDHGWPISDCTAEGTKASLALRQFSFIYPSAAQFGSSTSEAIYPSQVTGASATPPPVAGSRDLLTPITDARLMDAVEVMLSLQNPSGGWASYENTRTGGWLEAINPSECFSNIMVDYPYVECSSAVIQAFCMIRKMIPDNPRMKEINESIRRGVAFMKSIQRPDGSWHGSWGVCYTYAGWFGIEGMIAAGVPPSDPAIVKACKFFLSKQREDGGWGESYLSCVKREYVQHPETSQIVNTAWVVLSLMAAHWPDRTPIERGIRLLISRQYPNGDFPQESIVGVFNFNCMISYSNYKNIFPVWALGRYHNTYLKAKM